MNYTELLTADPAATIKLLTSQQKDQAIIENAAKEYKDLDRSIRQTQIQNTQKEKTVGEGTEQKLITPVRIPISFQTDIVETSVAFEVGEPVTINPEVQSALSDQVKAYWKSCRMDDKLQEAKRIQKSETECALMFYIATKADNTREIKVNILQHKNGVLSPHFDIYGDMDAFVWQFNASVDGKEISYTWVFDEFNVYKYSNTTGSLALDEAAPHGFGKIPIVYLSQEYPEWFIVEKLIDRYETSMARLVESNDYSGHPILAIFGTVQSMPEKDNSGKTLNFPIEVDTDGKESKGDAKFITNDNAPDAIKLELDNEKDLIYALTATPDLSFNNLKGIGPVSGVALRLMFMGSIMKAKRNEGENRTIIERCLNLFTAGTVTTIQTALSTQAQTLTWNITFNSVLPNDLAEAVTTYSQAVSAGIMSQETAVGKLGEVENVDAEIALIKAEQASETPSSI